MKIPNTITTNRITLFLDGVPKTIGSDHKNFEKILKTLRKKDHSDVLELLQDQTEEKLNERLSLVCDGVRVSPNGVKVNIGDQWRKVDSYVTNYIFAEYEAGNENLDHLLKYVSKVFQNPSFNSVEQLYPFLEKHNLVIDEDGDVLAFKGVKDDYYSVMGNTKTIVLQGEVNNQGHILNKVGSTIEVARNCVVDDPEQECAEGLHCGSYSFASGWGERLILVKFNPADAVSVPKNNTFHKCRVCKYTIVKEIDKQTSTEEKSPVKEYVDPNNAPKTIEQKLVAYIDKKLQEKGQISIKQISKNLKTGLTSAQILSIAKKHNYKISGDENYPSTVDIWL